jgi:4-hydroxybenzoyl-CoA thioesterase
MTPAPPSSPAPPSAGYLAQRKVRFGDCDPAGIVYFPRYFEMLNGVIEDWWQDIGLSWATVLPQRDIVTPVSHLEAQFLRPSRHGDHLDIVLTIEALTRSSIRLALRASGADPSDERLRARARMVCVSTISRSPQAWPQDIRDTLAARRPPR